MLIRRSFLLSSIAAMVPNAAMAVWPWVVRTLFVGYSRWGARRAISGLATRTATRSTARVGTTKAGTARVGRSVVNRSGKVAVVGGVTLAPVSAGATPLPSPMSILIDRRLSEIFGSLYDQMFTQTVELDEGHRFVTFDTAGTYVPTNSSIAQNLEMEVNLQGYNTRNPIEIFAHNFHTRKSLQINQFVYSAGQLGRGSLTRELEIPSWLPSGNTVIVYVIGGEVVETSEPFVIG